MSLTDEERRSVVALRMDKARIFLAEARKMIELEMWDLAANRFYYACFHAAQAALVHGGFSAHTHAGTISTFGLHFIRTEKVDKRLGAFFSRMEQLRMKADYNCNFDVVREDVEGMSEPAHEFVAAIEKIIS